MRATPDSWFSGRIAACLALALVVFFSRAWLIRTWGSPLPFWDQWGTEAVHLFRPWMEGTLRWDDFFLPQNEHRIVLTKLADLALFAVIGRWNMWWELLLNAMLHAAVATGLVYFFWSELVGRSRAIWLLGLVLLFTSASGWQNALWGFQSQVYFCSLLSLHALSGLLNGPPFHCRWWFGWTMALLALFTQASGVLAAVSAFGVGSLILFLSRISFFNDCNSNNPMLVDKRAKLAMAGTFTLIVLGWMLRVPAPQHALMQARSLAQFTAVFARSIGWPWINSGWMWLIMQAPLLWFTAALIRRRRRPTQAESLALGLALLSWLHASAVAYHRGAGLFEARPLSRYQDSLLLGAAANFFLLLHLAPKHRHGRSAALIWSGVLVAGLLDLTVTHLSLNLPYKRQQDNASMLQIRTYLHTSDAAIFTRDAQFHGLHPDSAAVIEVLDDPLLRSILPAEIENPSTRLPGIIESSPWLMLLSAFGFFWVMIHFARRST